MTLSLSSHLPSRRQGSGVRTGRPPRPLSPSIFTRSAGEKTPKVGGDDSR